MEEGLKLHMEEQGCTQEWQATAQQAEQEVEMAVGEQANLRQEMEHREQQTKLQQKVFLEKITALEAQLRDTVELHSAAQACVVEAQTADLQQQHELQAEKDKSK